MSPFLLAVVLSFASVSAYSASMPRAINAPSSAPYPIHLGGPDPEWSVFEGRKPYGPDLRLKFNSSRNTREHTLFIRQDDVKQDWTVLLNGRKLGSLFLMEADLIHTLPIPPDLLRDGENELYLSSKTPDDILIHSLAIADDTKANLLAAGPLSVRMVDSTGAPLPARITVIDANGTFTPLLELPADPNSTSVITKTNLAIRPGVAYTGTGSANLGLLPGKYTLFATRGSEYSLAETNITLGVTPVTVTLSLEREVNTSGWAASDTHIHTLSLSKHGDCLLHERMITLAAEGVELPVTTEHNLHGDYAPAARALGLDKYFTVVPGNEVTTKMGHFNVFPVSLSASPANHTIENWPDLIEGIRQGDSTKVVILNHPTDTHSGFTPFAATNLNPVTGKNLRGTFDFTFDAMELINSGAMRSDWMEPFRAWFALLNRGQKVIGIGSSDCHDVSRFIVGQGRTYIQMDDSTVANLDVQKASAALKQGRAVVSLGLYPQLRISPAPDALSPPVITTQIAPASAAGPGDLYQDPGEFIEVHGTVDFPAWINPAGRTIATLYANGRPKLVFPFDLKKTPGQPLGFKMRLVKPKTDTWYVLVAETPGVTNAYWSIARPYQPSSPVWDPIMIGATNPIWLDADGDGRFTAPRLAAKRLFDAAPVPNQLLASLAEFDWAVAVHAAELLHESGTDLQSPTFQQELKSASLEVQQAFADYQKTILKQ